MTLTTSQPAPESGVETVYTNFHLLLREIRAGVVERGVGGCEVRLADDPLRRMLGWAILSPKDEYLRCWSFTIPLTRFKGDLTGAAWIEQVKSVEGRTQIAQWLQEGRTIEEMEALCTPPA